MYDSMGNKISVTGVILLDGENISFDGSPVMYVSSTDIPLIIIINRMYENTNLLYIVPLVKHTNVCG